MIPFSVLDLSPVPDGHKISDALSNTVDLAQEAEAVGYNRFWMAEHHNMPGIASAATSVLIGHVAGQTKRMRIGAGGIMLPNHAPLVIAEQFGTLATLYPDRIDLGLGRAPGTDGVTMQALRRNMSGPDRFPQDVMELVQLFQDPTPEQQVHAFPGEGTHVPVWLLGSSLYGAQLAAYPTVTFIGGEAVSASGVNDDFAVELADGAALEDVWDGGGRNTKAPVTVAIAGMKRWNSA